MTAILFLDYDGVLHPEPCHDSPRFGRLPLLEEALAQLPDWQVVVSSSWRHGRTLAQLRSSFSPALRLRVVGMTPSFKDIADTVPEALRRFPREAECRRWLQDHAVPATPWLALDDCPWLFTPLCPHVIETDCATGLLDQDVTRLLQQARSLGGLDLPLP